MFSLLLLYSGELGTAEYSSAERSEKERLMKTRLRQCSSWQIGWVLRLQARHSSSEFIITADITKRKVKEKESSVDATKGKSWG